MGPIDGWRADHAKFERVLDVLDHELGSFHAGRTPDYEAMLDVVSYLRDYGDAYHHPKEDVALERLLARDPSLELPVARLLQEHRVIAAAGDALSQQLRSIIGGSIVERSIVEMAAATYLNYYRHHMAVEEQHMIPRAAKLLTAADWNAVADAVAPGAPARTVKDFEAPYRDLLERASQTKTHTA